MDRIIEKYYQIIKAVLSDYVNINYAYGNIKNEAIFDDVNHRYIILSVGWQDDKRIHGCLIHVDIIDNKVWIQRDGTEDGIAYELEKAGIPKDDIVLGFHEPNVRKYTGYAIASSMLLSLSRYIKNDRSRQYSNISVVSCYGL